MAHFNSSMRRALLFCWSMWLVLFAGIPISIGQTLFSFPEMLDDAELTDVLFTDPDVGIAIGDRGVILRTDDSGRHWRLVDAPVSCRLESICFVDEKRGWIAGGWIHPYTHLSSAAILRTEDGGRRWSSVSAPTLPSLRYIKFFDDQNGVAFGNASPIFGSGVFRTSDGGRSWSGLPGAPHHSWVSGDCPSSRTGAVADEAGQLAIFTRGELALLDCPTSGRRAQAIRLVDRRTSWLVGDSGLILTSSDSGRSWDSLAHGGQKSVNRPNSDVAALSPHFHWQAVSVLGQSVWLCGRPGTAVARSRDGGQTWETFPTGQTVPLNAIRFLDEQRGWAVGALGTIMATRDGGCTWRRQHGMGRVALLALVSSADKVPLELLARISGAEGFVGAVEVLDTCPQAAPTGLALLQRLRQAVMSAGGSAASIQSTFEVMNPANIVEPSTYNPLDIETVTAGIVGLIRQWQPDVIATDDKILTSTDSSPRLSQLILSAAHAAADSTFSAELVTDTQLPAWKVKKVVVATSDAGGSLSISPAQFVPRFARSLGEQTILARGLLAQEYRLASPTSFQVFGHDLPYEIARKDFLSGISLTPGSDGRRQISPVAIHDDDPSRVSHRQRITRVLLNRTIDNLNTPQLLGQLEDLTNRLSPSDCGDLLFSLAARSHQSGQSNMAAELNRFLLSRFPNHELADAAMRWLVQYYTSSEAACRETRDSTTAHALECGKQMELSRPILYTDPHVRFPLAAAMRGQGANQDAEKAYLMLAGERSTLAWRQCASSELWLNNRRGPPPQSICNCPILIERPRLDGDLRDPCWEQAAHLSTAFSNGESKTASTEVKVTCDQDFLFVALKCAKSSRCAYPAATGTRGRDADLSEFDRVDFFLDVDRDYTTCYQFSLDHRGRTAEACLGDWSWNPKWYVASVSTDTEWRVEIAFPIEELVPARDPADRVWVMNLRRTVPGQIPVDLSGKTAGLHWSENCQYLILK